MTDLVNSDDFMCRCGDEKSERCDKVLARAREIVSAHRPLANDIDFVNRLLYWLTLDGDLSILADQWAGVYVKPFEGDYEHFLIKEPVRIQCDNIVDGLAAAVVFYFSKDENDDSDSSSEDDNTDEPPKNN